MLEAIDNAKIRSLSSIADSIGITCFTLEDDLYFVSTDVARRRSIADRWRRPIVEGEASRDWKLEDSCEVIFPYNDQFEPVDIENYTALLQFMWPCKTNIGNSILFGRKTKVNAGLKWIEFGRLTYRKFLVPYSIAFAEISTHNHFIFDRGGKIFNRSAPVIKLPGLAIEDDYLALLGVLNSSLSCFWLRQVCQPKGGSGIGRGVQDEPWEERFVFNATRIGTYPVPRELPLFFGQELDNLAQHLKNTEPRAVCTNIVPGRERLSAARAEYEQICGRMIGLQEELDWEVYRCYGLLDDAEAAQLIADPDDVPELKLGERAFEIVLARRLAARDIDTQWFARHRSTPITKIPAHWPEAYKLVVAKRIETIGSRRDIALIERPECKRRWQSEPWESRERAALTSWLLDRCEDRELWFAADEWGREQPRPVTVNRLADRLRADADVVSVARLLDGPDADLADVLTRIIADQYVPYLAQLRYTPSGTRKRAQWEETWDKQREEDRQGVRLNIDVPPKYKKEDFTRTSYWSQRGKLDVPKERFISYLLASPDGDDSLLLGWAGWDYREQAHALMTLIEERSTKDGWGVAKLTPLIAGLAEVMPWVRQWHADADPAYGMSPAEAYDAYLEDQRVKYGLSEQDLRKWSPPSVERKRGRRRGPGKASPADKGTRHDADDQDEGA